MIIESIHQEPLENTSDLLTKVVIDQVESQCILTRVMATVFGKPGVENDMEFWGSGDRWVILWTQPQLSLADTEARLAQVLAH